MTEHDWLAERFEADRGHLRAVAYRMLGSLGEAEDAVQEAWLRLSRSDSERIDNLGGWLTTVVGRVCLDMLRSRKSRREDPLDDTYVPDVVIAPAEGTDPEQQALLADSVGLALLVVLETLSPAERLAFVLHDMFAVPFEEIADIIDKSPAATRQLASRARRRVQGAAPAEEPDTARQRVVVEAFLAAARGGDFEALVSVLHPDVLLRADEGAVGRLVRGAQAVASQAITFQRFSQYSELALVNGAYGLVTAPQGKVFSVMSFTVADGKVVEINILADPERVAELELERP
ncbi:RNA polymerase sigma factor SigJ [Kitasatospora viridis]|uniref:RNA polymerase sigma-70 factor (ECF subfamily) n=1 Tax=Kitasatospora viridis TaxID=281105 RepID=A0A561UHW3_9ACTN|nr:RNA polymerase sigma factor SigJ [Kitasatospora viridis]TWF98961.1 RNA polymerase sigma-70 factor (ECF subfamily) [Kitasatospora viridis]